MNKPAMGGDSAIFMKSELWMEREKEATFQRSSQLYGPVERKKNLWAVAQQSHEWTLFEKLCKACPAKLTSQDT